MQNMLFWQCTFDLSPYSSIKYTGDKAVVHTFHACYFSQEGHKYGQLTI